MPYTVRIKPKAEKYLEKIPDDYKWKIKVALVSLQNDPFLGKKLFGKYKGQYSINLWPYRIIYEIYKHQLLIIVINIGHRQGIY